MRVKKTKTKNDLELVWIVQKLVGPTNDVVFGLVLNVCLHHLKTQNFDFG